ncbi:sugar transporter [Defluviimonas sp. SAOS-178_SWC]|uniref:sugar transporter n=1 Tax=Defluviimonas sp. SAOS-178_SWC TaxID=3121287 RepID=UPI0032217BE6
MPGTRLTNIRPVAVPARMHRRHWGLLLGLGLGVLLPLALVVAYLFLIAEDQYSSTVGFTVRREEGADAAAGLMGGLASFVGTSSSSEADILYEFIQSQEIVEAVNARIDLRAMYSAHWPGDPIFALNPSDSIEDLLSYWRRMVRISYDQSTRLIELRVLAFTPEDARTIGNEILIESQKKINDLNTAAREDVMRYANADLEVALTRLKASREAMTNFRTRTQIVDPESDIQGRMGVLNNLQQQLAQALIEYDLLAVQTENAKDPRIAPAQRRIEVIRERIAAERQIFATASSEVGELGEEYPKLIAEYESLSVDREYAERSYTIALAAVDVARAEASRQSLYLAPFIRPTLPETSEYPQRFVLSGLAALFLFLAWAIVTLVYYSVRDRR